VVTRRASSLGAFAENYKNAGNIAPENLDVYFGIPLADDAIG